MSSLARGIFLALIIAAATVPVAHAQYGAYPQEANAPNQRGADEQIFALSNQARAQAGVGRLQWDPALAEAALAHCRRMAEEGPIAHRYGGEKDMTGRAADAGAHFSVMEENVAVGTSPGTIHEAWMQSPGHRSNLLSPEVNRVGIAVVAARGVLYAVADYSRAVEQLNVSEAEARVAALIRVSGVAISRDPTLARQACTTNEGLPQSQNGATPRFVMRWQSGDLDRLPPTLVEKLASGNYRQAAIGSCPAQISQGSFSGYRMAVLLY